MCWTKQLEFKLLWPFYISQIIQSIFLLTTAYWVIYFLSLGYSLAQISFLPTVMLLTMLIFEIPTGFLADLKGRKWTVVIAIFLGAISIMLIPFIGPQFKMLLALYAVMGIGAALASGASEAWVVDFLHGHAKSSAIPHYYAALHLFINIGLIVAPLLASAIFFLTGVLHYLWWIEGIMLFSAGLILAVFGKEKRVEQERFQLTFSLLYQKTVTHFRERPVLIHMTAVMFFFAMIFGMTTLAWQPFLQAKGVPLVWFGILFAFAGALAIAYPLIQKSLLSRIGNRRLLQFISIIQMVAFGILTTIPFVGVIVLFFVIRNLDSIKIPIFQPWFQKNVPSVARSIFGSIIALVGAIGEGTGYILASQFVEKVGFNIIWWFVAGLCVVITIILGITRRVHHNEISKESPFIKQFV